MRDDQLNLLQLTEGEVELQDVLLDLAEKVIKYYNNAIDESSIR